jgi:drug/metabolite transporter (DMT)-like permease
MTPPASSPVRTDARRGIGWMLLAMLLAVIMDVIAKHLMESHSVAQVIWARYAFHLAALALIFGRRYRAALRTPRPALQTARSVVVVISTALIFPSLQLIALADVYAVLAIAPLLITALSVPVLGERVGPRRWAGVVAGFVGALIIIRPGSGAMHVAALVPLAAAAMIAVFQLITRLVSHTDAPMTTVAHTPIVGAVAASCVAPFFWTAPDPLSWGLMAAMGGFGGAFQICIVRAYAQAPAAAIAPYNYSNLVWASLFGFLVFAEVPDPWTVVGAGVITASGLYVFRRERLRSESPRAAPESRLSG